MKMNIMKMTTTTKTDTDINVVGIDYSLTCPAICVYGGEFDDCNVSYLTSKKKYAGKFGNIEGQEIRPYNDPVERFTHLSSFILDKLPENPKIFIEGYSFGSRGRALFQIAENGGILKYRLTRHKYEIIPPANIKKFATGKGNADKEKMYDKFYEDTGVNLMERLDQQTLASPVTDIVDAYYISKYGYESFKSK